MLKRGILAALKITAVAAAVVAVFAPVGTFNQLLIFVVSVAVFVGCLLVSNALDSDGSGDVSIWPDIRKGRQK